MKELVETEANYVDCLNMLRRNFIRTITKMKKADRDVRKPITYAAKMCILKEKIY